MYLSIPLATFIIYLPFIVAVFCTGMIIGVVMAQDAFYENMLWKIKEIFHS